jgi:PKD repeat protein
VLTATVMTGSNVSYMWSFGDHDGASGAVVGHIYPAAGTYTAVITASNWVSLAVERATVVIRPISVYLPVALVTRN